MRKPKIDEIIPDVVTGRKLPLKGTSILLVVLLVIVGFSLARSCVEVKGGERAVVFSKMSGVRPRPLGQGFHVLVPLIWQATLYDVKTMTYTMSGISQEGQVKGNDAIRALTSDGLEVQVDLSVQFHVDPDKVAQLHQEIGPQYIEKIVRPEIRSDTRMVISAFRSTDIYTGAKRQEIEKQIKERMVPRFTACYLVLENVLLRSVQFPETFQAAIERKQVALQDTQKMDYVIERAKKERDQKIVQAEGEAAAIRQKAQALAENPQLIPYEYVQGLPDAPKTIVADSRTLLNLGDVLGGQ
jgi:regulator of protease activity HflC (stomatin/prohibitin superfamily)